MSDAIVLETENSVDCGHQQISEYSHTENKEGTTMQTAHNGVHDVQRHTPQARMPAFLGSI